MDGFSSFYDHLFAILVYYLEARGVSSVVLVGNVNVNCTGDMSTVFLYSIFKTSTGYFF